MHQPSRQQSQSIVWYSQGKCLHCYLHLQLQPFGSGKLRSPLCEDDMCDETLF